MTNQNELYGERLPILAGRDLCLYIDFFYIFFYILKIVVSLDESRIHLKYLIIYVMHLKLEYTLIEVFMIHKQRIPMKLF